MHNSSKTHSAYFKKSILWIPTILAIIAGVYLRLKGLDKAPFTIDEYYIATSVQNIIEKGIPEFNCGGYYTRGILYQYILSPLFAYGSNDELYARLVTVASNILTVPALYLLAKQLSGKTVACMTIILFFLSIWEIEFSRFARMYAPFQMIFIWYIYFLYNWAYLNNKKAEICCYSLSLVSIFVYEGGVFLVLLNFLPFFIKQKHFHKSSILISSGILAVAYTYLTTNFRFLGTETIASSTYSFIIAPPLMVTTLQSDKVWLVIYLVISATMILGAIKSIKKLPINQDGTLAIYKIILIISLAGFSLLNSYALVALTITLALTLNWIKFKELINKNFFQIFFPVFLMLIFWIAYGFLTSNWSAAIDPEKHANTKQLFITLFKYPDILNKFILVFYQTMPIFTLLSALILFIGSIDAFHLDKDKRRPFLFLLSILIILIILISALRQPYISTRYFFFLYPLIILLIIMTFHNLLKRFSAAPSLAVIIPVLVFMIMSEDFRWHHYANITNNEIIYRTIYNEQMTNHLYARWDFRSPAKFINNNSSTDDIIITSTYAVPYYLNRLDYFYHDQGRDNFINGVGCSGRKNLRTNANLISLPHELLSIINNPKSTVWLIAKSNQYQWATPVEKKISTDFSKNIIYKSADKNLNVYKFTQH